MPAGEPLGLAGYASVIFPSSSQYLARALTFELAGCASLISYLA